MRNKGNKSRTFILLLLFLILAAAVIIENIEISIDRNGGYNDPVVSTKNVRGTIYDRHGTLVAFDTNLYGCLVLDDGKTQSAADAVSSFTSLSPLEISGEISNGTRFFPLADQSKDAVEKAENELLRSAAANSVAIESRRTRSTPYSSLSLILGSSSSSNEGKGGIEELFNSYLSASPTLNSDAVYGEDLVLTIDVDYEEILVSALEKAGYESDAAILNSRGEIIAWYGNADEGLLRNICYSHSSREKTELFNREEYIPSDNTVSVPPFSVYLSVSDEKALSEIKAALGSQS